MRRIALVMAFVLAVTACSGDGEPASPTTSMAASAPATTSTVEPTTSTAAIAAAPDPLDIGISIHVEGFDDRTPEVYARHLEAVERVAREAQAAGITITFELGRPFTDGAVTAGDDWVARLPARGQAVGVHADLGGRPLPPQQFARRLREHRALVEQLVGGPVTHVSGVCSEGQWVEPIIDAGFTSATGMVEFCLKSLDVIPAEYDTARIEACTTPADCHGQAPTDDEHKLHPWRTSTSADWLTDDPAGKLVLVSGESGRSLACLAESSEGRCTPSSDDISKFAEIVRSYVAKREPGRHNILTMSWSIGGVPPEGFVSDLAASVADLPVRWLSVADLGSD